MKLKIIGVIILLLTVGLSGCTDDVDDTTKDEIDSDDDTISYNELYNHVNKYINQKITVKGYVGYVNLYSVFLYESSDPPYSKSLLLNVHSDITIYIGWYNITGIVKSGSYPFFAAIDVISVEII